MKIGTIAPHLLHFCKMWKNGIPIPHLRPAQLTNLSLQDTSLPWKRHHQHHQHHQQQQRQTGANDVVPEVARTRRKLRTRGWLTLLWSATGASKWMSTLLSSDHWCHSLMLKGSVWLFFYHKNQIHNWISNYMSFWIEFFLDWTKFMW